MVGVTVTSGKGNLRQARVGLLVHTSSKERIVMRYYFRRMEVL